MSFLDRFKRQPGEENVPAKEVKLSPAAVPPRLAEAPGNARPRAAGVLPTEPPPRGSAPRNEPKHELQLELSDFLPRIAPALLHAGPHEGSAKLTFDIAELAERIARGQTSIRLAEIYRRAPEVFREEIYASDETEVRFPWQKVLRMLASARAVPTTVADDGLTPAAADVLAETLRSRRAARNLIPGSNEPARKAAIGESGTGSQDEDAPPCGANPDGEAAPNSPLIDDETLTHEELIRARDAMRAQLRRARGEQERQLTVFAQERQKTTEERQRFVAEMLRLKKEADEKDGQVQFEKEVAAKNADTLAKLREANAALARQLTESTGAKKADPERSPKEHQRQLDELLHRITTLESHQRDAALELGREREAKIKLERQLSNTDRLAGESTVKVEETLTAARRDFEMTLQKRAAVAAQTLQEAHEKLAAANAARERLAAELAAARDHSASASAASSAAVSAEAWEGRAAAQFEADIENYRSRIRNLLGEREVLTQEKTALAEQLAAASKQSQQLSTAHAQLTRELEAARTSGEATTSVVRVELQKLRDDHSAAQNESENLRAEMAVQTTAWATERATLAGELAAAHQTHESAAAAHRESQAAHENLADKLASTQAALGELRTELQQSRDALATAQNDGAKLRTELAAQATASTAERAALAEELASVRQAHESAVSAHEALRTALEKTEAGRTALTAQLADAQTAHAAAVASLTDESANLGAKARALHSELTELKATHATATENFRTATTAQAAEMAAQTARQEQLQREKTALETQCAEAERELAKLRARVQQTDVTLAGAEVAIRHHDEALAKLREQHEQAVATRAAEDESARAAANAEKEEMIRALQARHEEDLRSSTENGSRLAGEIARLTETVATAQRESAAAAQSLAAANAEADRKFATYQRERDGLLAERRLAAAELEAAQDALKAQAVVFARDLKRARQQRDPVSPQPADLATTLSDEPGDAPTIVPPRPQRARKAHAENQADNMASPPAEEIHTPAEESGRLKIQRVRPVPIRPPQVQSR